MLRATAAPAKILGYEGTVGTLRPGANADIALLELRNGNVEMTDSDGNTVTGKRRLIARHDPEGRPRLLGEAGRLDARRGIWAPCCWRCRPAAPRRRTMRRKRRRTGAAVLARLPADAAQRLFGAETTPAPGPARPIGEYTKGCLEGGVALPADGPNWQVMRPSRNRAWGHPALIALSRALAQKLPAQAGWPGSSRRRHRPAARRADADRAWLAPDRARRRHLADADARPAARAGPSARRCRRAMSSPPIGKDVDPAVWTPQHRASAEAVAREPGVARIFVNPAIKRALCREAGPDRAWLAKIRPWWGHNYHFHIRLSCPGGEPECHDQAPPPPGDGCGKELAWWFTAEALPPAALATAQAVAARRSAACLRRRWWRRRQGRPCTLRRGAVKRPRCADGGAALLDPDAMTRFGITADAQPAPRSRYLVAVSSPC